MVDPRKPRGIRHQLVSILAATAVAVIAGARSSVAAAQWAAHAPAEVLAALEIRVDPRTGAFVVPHESTIRRTLQACDGDLLDKALGTWLYPRLPTEQILTVDGKTLRGAEAGDGRAVHVLAAMLADDRAVLAQREIPHKTNEVRREASCRIPAWAQTVVTTVHWRLSIGHDHTVLRDQLFEDSDLRKLDEDRS